MKRWKEKPWFNNAVVACIAVSLYVLLMRLPNVREGLRTFFGFFTPVIWGCVMAYIVNPLSKLFGRSIFRWIKHERRREFVSNFLAFILIILLLVFLLLLLIPQIIESVQLFVANLDGYVASLTGMLEQFGVSASMLNLEEVITSSETLLDSLSAMIKNNLNEILSTSVNAGRGIVQFIIAFLLSMYLLADKHRLKDGAKRLLRALTSEERSGRIRVFFERCHTILNRYIAFNILDSIIIGVANVTFMSIFGMPYIGLVSFVVAVTNLIPTFGPVIGAIVGGFVLVLVNPWYALAFLIFTAVLQLCDSYLIKPRLFGTSLGVSGLWILIGVIVGGRMFGVVGILLAIPGVAIIDMLYQDYLLPWLEARRNAPEIQE